MKMRLMQKKISSSGIARLSSHFISRSFINQNESHPMLARNVVNYFHLRQTGRGCRGRRGKEGTDEEPGNPF
jgi:hypothetical protein